MAHNATSELPWILCHDHAQVPLHHCLKTQIFLVIYAVSDLSIYYINVFIVVDGDMCVDTSKVQSAPCIDLDIDIYIHTRCQLLSYIYCYLCI